MSSSFAAEFAAESTGGCLPTVHHDGDPTEFDEAAGIARGNDSIQVRHEQTNEFVIRNIARRHTQRVWPSHQVRANRESLDPWSRPSIAVSRAKDLDVGCSVSERQLTRVKHVVAKIGEH